MNPPATHRTLITAIYLLVGIVAIISVAYKLKAMEAETVQKELTQSRAFVDAESKARQEAFKRLREQEAKRPRPEDTQSSKFGENLHGGVDAGVIAPGKSEPVGKE